MCTLGQEFEDSAEFSSSYFIGEVFEDEESEQEDTCFVVEGVEDLIGV